MKRRQPPGEVVRLANSPVQKALRVLERLFAAAPQPRVPTGTATRACGELLGRHVLNLVGACGELNLSGSHSAAVTLFRPLEDALDCLAAVTLVAGAADRWLADDLKPSEAAKLWVGRASIKPTTGETLGSTDEGFAPLLTRSPTVRRLLPTGTCFVTRNEPTPGPADCGSIMRGTLLPPTLTVSTRTLSPTVGKSSLLWRAPTPITSRPTPTLRQICSRQRWDTAVCLRSTSGCDCWRASSPPGDRALVGSLHSGEPVAFPARALGRNLVLRRSTTYAGSPDDTRARPGSHGNTGDEGACSRQRSLGD